MGSRHRWKHNCLLPLVFGALIACAKGERGTEPRHATPTTAPKTSRVETKKVEYPWEKGEFLLSPDGSRFAIWPGEGTAQSSVFLDGQPGPRLDKLGSDSLQFSPDSKHLAYMAVIDKKWVVVFDGKRSVGFDDLGDEPILFSPNSKRIAFIAANGENWFIVADGKPGMSFDGISSFQFSPDSEHVTYLGKRSKNWMLMLDGGVASEVACDCPVGNSLQFSSSGRSIAFAIHPNKWKAVVNGKAGPEFDGIGPFQFAPRGSRYGYAGERGDKWFAVVDGKLSPPWDEIIIPGIVFSSDSKHFAYFAKEGDKWRLVVDGKPGQEFQKVGADTLKFDPDPAHMTYVAKQNGKWRAVVAGEPKPEYDDGGVDAAFLVGDSRLMEDKTSLFTQPIAVLSPDYKRMAIMQKKSGIQIVLDNKPGPLLADVDPSSIAFSADSKHLVYKGRIQGGQHTVVLDNELGPLYDGLYTDRPRFQADGGVRYVASKGRELYIVKQFPSKP